MPRFSANLGFLWTDRSLPEAIRAAARAGFAAVECHWPYDEDAGEVAAALSETGLPMLGINTVRGGAGEFGLAALPGREVEARAAIEQAVAYAMAIGAQAVHVMAGKVQGPAARAVFLDNLDYACGLAGQQGITVLIEPLNQWDAPGYFLQTTDQADEVIGALGAANLKLMFDCYHVARQEGDVAVRLERLLPIIGHIQFAGVPERGAPELGDLDYNALFRTIDSLGWSRPLGAEYRPEGDTRDSLGWMTALG
ncbi:TIM barrel protein [Alisedimentitalea sp. MJ-SS2]|uniref:hydroxypyruvate isomerase family protein n=1 Tax=Aliisedimentitalea sp. MJ-SS2 TaxID=3049795 RepID=UPI002914654C|nr:TIM barrel protein [Alisedimentitalea sp. MJ-SS2]MDU8925823.1 TIM barrel protein [Alisedimentitalea sp. MJ-SS2]